MSKGFPYGSAGKESACNVGDLGFIPGLGRSPGEGKGHPLQYPGLENSMDCRVHGVRSRTQLNDFHFHYYHIHYYISDIIVVILQCLCYNNTIIFSQPSILVSSAPAESTVDGKHAEKKLQKVPKNKTSICHTLATVHILFTLPEALQVV